MWFKTVFVLFIIILFISSYAAGQKNPDKQSEKELYESIEAYSGKSKFTKFIYRLFFKPVLPAVKKKRVYKKLIQKPYSTFEGKVIRHIIIETLDPFGNSIADTMVASGNFLTRAGNGLHVQSHTFTIRSLLLIGQNQLFDSLRVRESERLIRSQKYVRDVSFYVVATSKNADSVDIFIRELDTWSLIPAFEVTRSRLTLGLTDRNLFGMGHEARLSYTRDHIASENAFEMHYIVPSIYNTFINAALHYGIDEFGDFGQSIAFERPFFSPLKRWAAGVKFSQQRREAYIPLNDTLYQLHRFKYNAQDYWAGISFPLFKGNPARNHTTNFISAARFLRIRYLEKPIDILDEQHMFSDENIYLASIGISTRKYVQDKYIFKFGMIEDIPVGSVFNFTGGYQEKNNSSRIYLGARISFGNYYPWGYLSTDFEFGSFIRVSHPEQGVFSAGLIYFTGLVEWGRWKFRQFVKPQVVIGIKPQAYDSLTLNDGYGLAGFKSAALSGTSRLLLTLQSQSYAPWNFIGFRFGPFLTCSVGMLGDSDTGFKNSQVYAQIGFGILIKNDYLVINTFQLSVSFYPIMPDGGHGIFKFNSFKTADFGFGDFDIGKPATVLYQ
jgi:hypothetical protein